MSRMRIRFSWITVLSILFSLLAFGEAQAAGVTTRVSVDSAENQGNNASTNRSISADGRYVAFESASTNLVAGDTNTASDIFVHDRQTGQTTRVSVNSVGSQVNYSSTNPSISADGRYVAFESYAPNLVAGDTNGVIDIFVHDRQTGQATRVSVDSAGNQGNNASTNPSISADGRYVAFDSVATNLVAGDTNNGARDVFVHDRQTGQTTQVSVDSAGNQGNNLSSNASISADGQHVAFYSFASNLIAGDNNGVQDVFVHDRQTGQTSRVSVSSSGSQGNSNSLNPSISGDGRFVAFESGANNLVAGDTGYQDVFVHDRQTGQTTRVSVNSAGAQGNGGSKNPSISTDGRYVAFWSWANNLVAGKTNSLDDIFVHDRQTGQTSRLSVDSSGNGGNNHSTNPSISADGRYVAFESRATNLVPGDTNGDDDIFVHSVNSSCGAFTTGLSLSGVVRDSVTNLPMPGVTVRLLGVTTAVTDGSGHYSFGGLSTGSFQISFTLSGYQPLYGIASLCDSNRTLPDVVLAKGSSVFGLSPSTHSGFSADPVNTSTGNYVFQRTDLSIPGKGFPFTFSRTYNSQDNTVGPLGYGWTHNYASILAVNPDGTVTIRLGDGKTDTWTPDGSGGYTPQFGVFDTLASLGGGSYSLTKKDRTVHQFNSIGRLASVTDRNGNALSLSYSGSLLSQVTDTAGRSIQFTSNGSGQITRITDPIGRRVDFAYDGAGNLISSTDLNGNATTFTYDDNHQMLTATDPRGNVLVTNTYDGSQRVASQWDAKGGQTTYYYDAVNRWTAITNSLGQTSYHFYDDKLRLIEEQDPLGRATSYAYDTAGNRTDVTDRNGYVTQYAYDARGNVTSKTDASGAVTTISYDGTDNPLSRSDALGATTLFEYDAKGNLLRQTDPLGRVTSFAYNASGALVSTTDANGHTTAFGYDAAGNLAATTDALGNLGTSAYDGVGRRLTKTDALGNTTTFAYDANSNVLSVTDPLDNVIRSTYDGNNNRLTATDALGSTTAFAYDVKDLRTAVTDALGWTDTTAYDALDRKIAYTDKRGGIIQFVYDAAGNLVQSHDADGYVTTYTYDNNANRLTETDPLGNTTALGFDALNRVVSRTDPVGNVETTVYDAAGRVSSRTNAKGQTTQFAYDLMGRLTQVTDPGGGLVDYAYDNVGNRTSMTDPNGNTTVYAYDALNRRVRMTERLGNRTTYAYDAVGNLVSMTDPNGKTTTYPYDANNRLTQVTYWDASTVRYQYDPNGNRTQMTDGIGTSTYVYDLLNRMTSATDGFGKTLGYAYDANGNVIALTYPDGKQVQYAYDLSRNQLGTVTDWQGRTTFYAYDGAGRMGISWNYDGSNAQYTFDGASRLTGLVNRKSDGTVISSYAYTLDPVGNHLQVTQTEPLLPAPTSKVIPYSYDGENRLVSVGATPYAYDNNGNTLSGGSSFIAYDPANRPSGSTIGGVSSAYRYDGAGNRMERIAGGSTTRYVQDTNRALPNVVAETDGSGSITSYYVYGLGLVSKILPNGTAYYYHFDSRGSTVALTDASQNITDAYVYDPFGEVVEKNGTTPNPFQYLGKHGVVDDGNGTLQVRARYYLPGIGRFVTKDSLTGNDGDSQSLHRYVYAVNSPIINLDPSGLFDMDAASFFNWIGKESIKKAPVLLAMFRDGSSSLQPYVKSSNLARNVFGGTVGNIITLASAGLESGVYTWNKQKYNTNADYIDDLTLMAGELAVMPLNVIMSPGRALGKALINYGTQGDDEFRNELLNDKYLKILLNRFTGDQFNERIKEALHLNENGDLFCNGPVELCKSFRIPEIAETKNSNKYFKK